MANTSITFNTIGHGHTSASLTFQGCLDEVRILEEALSWGQVQGIYNSNDPNAIPPRTLHHRYDGDFADSSGSGRDGFGRASYLMRRSP